MAGTLQDRSSTAINLGGPMQQFENKELQDESHALAQQESHNRIQISMDSVMDEGYKASGNVKGGANMQGSKASANSKKGGKQNKVIDLKNINT